MAADDERGSQRIEATGGGFFARLGAALAPGVMAGGGLGDAGAPLASIEAQAWSDKLKNGARNAVLGQYPGYGSLWTYDGAAHITRAGQMALGGALVLAYLVFSGGGRR